MVKQRLLGRFTLEDDQTDFVLTEGAHGADNVSLSAGNYYMFGYTGESTDQFIAHMISEIQSIGAPYLNFDMSYDTANDQITMDFDGYNVDITWTDPDLQNILGFQGSQIGDTQYTAALQPKYLWNPSNPASSYSLGLKEFWNPTSTSYVGRSKDGTTFSVDGSIIYDASVSWDLLSNSEVIIPDTGTVNKELQTFFEDVISHGYPIRVQTDSSQLTQEYFKTGVIGGEDEEPVGSFKDMVDRSFQKYNGLWNVELNFIKKV